MLSMELLCYMLGRAVGTEKSKWTEDGIEIEIVKKIPGSTYARVQPLSLEIQI